MNSPPAARPRWALPCALIALLAGAQEAAASYGVATSATAPGLRVDAKGDAEVAGHKVASITGSSSRRMDGDVVAPKADGSFSVYLRPRWVGRRYRATVQGRNVGGELAPDAQAIINAAR